MHRNKEMCSPHFRDPKCVRTFFVSRVSISLSSGSAFAFFFLLPPFLSVVEVGVGWFEPFSLSLAKEAATGVGAAGVEVVDWASAWSGYWIVSASLRYVDPRHLSSHVR